MYDKRNKVKKMQPNLNGSLESLLADKAMHQIT